MVHFYRAAPQPKNQTQTYVMYGLLAVAVIFGLFYLYKRNQNNSSANETPASSVTPMASVAPMASMRPTAAPIKLQGTTWKSFMTPDYIPFDSDRYDFIVFDAQKGTAVKTVDGVNKLAEPGIGIVTYSDDNGQMKGKLYDTEPTGMNMTYSFEDDESYGKLLVISTQNNKIYKLIKTGPIQIKA
jgi:hypothetical protein